MKSMILVLQTVILLWITIVTCDLYYIKTNANNEHNCSEPCLTLNDFVVNTTRNVNHHNISLIFLPGNHSLDFDLHLSSKEMVFMSSKLPSKVWVLCEKIKQFQYSNVNRVEIRNIQFFGCGGNNIITTYLIFDGCNFYNVQSLNAASQVLLVSLNSIVEIRNCGFVGNRRLNITAAVNSKINSTHSVYSNNTGLVLGSLLESQIFFHECNFTNNIAAKESLSFLISNKSVLDISNTRWKNNSLIKRNWIRPSALISCFASTVIIVNTLIEGTESRSQYEMGGILLAIFSRIVILNSIFEHNHGQNGSLLIRHTNFTFSNLTISHNTATNGNLIIIRDSKIAQIFNLKITENNGNIMIVGCKVSFQDGIMFTQNNGSLIFINSVATFTSSSSSSNYFAHNRQASGLSTVTSSEVSILSFYGNTSFVNNYSNKLGGAIHSIQSSIHMHGLTLVSNNTAEVSGGGIYLYQSDVKFHYNCEFSHNKATEKGGGIYAIASNIVTEMDFQGGHIRYLSFLTNSARLGGAMYMEQNSKFDLFDVGFITQYVVTFSSNKAIYGGAIYVDDNTVGSRACESKYYYTHSSETECFLLAHPRESDHTLFVNFINNIAKKAGPAIFGGLLDRCTVDLYPYDSNDHKPLSGFDFLSEISSVHLSRISSHPVRICYCSNNLPNCASDISSVALQRGDKVHLSLSIVDQVNDSINGTMYVVASSTVRAFDLSRQSYKVSNSSTCTHVTVQLSFYSDQLTLYPKGPCNNTGISQKVLMIEYSECICPIGFSYVENDESCKCECDPDLTMFNIKNCVFEMKSIVRENNIWIGYVNTSTYSGYLFYPNCPFDYCLPGTPSISINLNIPNGSDAQCAQHRTGILCGRCKPGYSMSLGGTVCLSCPKKWPGLLVANILAQALTGVILVALILILNTTVAIGTFNGLLFYANVVAANKNNFMPFSRPNVLTIFISFLNLDLGIDRCHIQGMDAYTNAWVSLIYPTYIISLVILVIIISQHSTLFTKIITRGNPVAALATLILVSYTKILHAIIKMLSFAVIQYPDGSTQVAWLTDASVKYFQGKHIPLFLTAVVILFLGIVYTVLLFFWQWLLKAPQKMILLSWTRNTKLNSFMDAYLAPYTLKYRYWTGLLLFARVVLYLLSAVNMSNDPSFNLLAIGVIIGCLILLQLYFRTRIYKNKYIDAFENTTYMNLLLFVITSYYSINYKHTQRQVACTSTGVAFVMFLGAFLYHILVRLYHVRCIGRAMRSLKQKLKQRRRRYDNDLQVNLIENTENHINIPTSTVVSLSPE